MSRLTIVTLTALLVAAAPGCRTVAPVDSQKSSHRLELTLWRSANHSQFTYFELEPDGWLHYAAGRSAQVRMPGPVTRLTPGQHDRLWQIIDTHGLMDVKPAGLRLFGKRPEPLHARYELHITAQGQKQAIHCIDDQVAGVKQLHGALFDAVATVRYGQLGDEGH